MRALVIEHGLDGGAEGIGTRLEARGFTLRSFRILDGMEDSHSDRDFPDLSNEDLLVVMGSVHSVYDAARIGSWIDREIAMVAESVEDAVRAADQIGYPVLVRAARDVPINKLQIDTDIVSLCYCSEWVL